MNITIKEYTIRAVRKLVFAHVKTDMHELHCRGG